MQSTNLGIVAHVDAGKTSLTERLLYHAGVIAELGSVDGGTTQTDSLSLERQRGITIRAAVASFVHRGVTINLVDTPGHPDFIAEVERALQVLDGAILVVSAVEGVQAQTRILMRTLTRLAVPTLIFVNKIDRSGADERRVLDAIEARLTPAIAPMGVVTDLGRPAASFARFPAAGPVEAADLAGRTRAGRLHPVFFGSAITGAGIAEVLAGVIGLLPRAGGRPEGAPAARVFKIERTPSGEQTAYVRVFDGTITVRDRLSFGGRPPVKITGLAVFEAGQVRRVGQVVAGQIAKVSGLSGVRVGDTLGPDRTGSEPAFPPPSLQTVVVPRRSADRGRLHAALTQLAEQDPLIDVRTDSPRTNAGTSEVAVSVYGEVQKEVIAATLLLDFGVEVDFRVTTPRLIERVIGTGAAVALLGEEDNPYLATVGLRVEPRPAGSGVAYAVAGDRLGTLPPAFSVAVAETVSSTLADQLRPVTDCRVTLTHTGYAPRQSHAHATFDKSMSSTAGDFRLLTSRVLLEAVRRAGTEVCEPMDRFELEIPVDALSRAARAPQSTPGPGRATPADRRSVLVDRDDPGGRGAPVAGCSARPHPRGGHGRLPARPLRTSDPQPGHEGVVRARFRA